MTLRGRHPGYEENEALRAEVLSIHGRQTLPGTRVVKTERGFEISDSGPGTVLLPLTKRETKMSEPDAFGRVNRVYADSGALVNNDSNEAAMSRTLQDARRHAH